MTIEKKKELIRFTLGKDRPDLVLKNGWVFDVFLKRFHKADVAIVKDRIVGVGEYTGRRELDMTGKYVVPGLLDAHVHIESSMTCPRIFSRKVLACGTAAVIADPHEIVNVCGSDGMDYMLSDSAYADVDIFFMLPSCVPLGKNDHNGAVFSKEDMAKYLSHPRVKGLGEVMNYPALLAGDNELLEKIALLEGGTIDGHAPGVSGKQIQAYRICGVQTDHECSTWQEARQRLEAGFFVQVREGSAARNLEAILTGALKEGVCFDRMVFCTDDLHLEDIEKRGHIDHCIRKAISLGVPPEDAIRMATLHTAQLYHLSEFGAVAPGYYADLVILDRLEDFHIVETYKHGIPVEEILKRNIPAHPSPEPLRNTVRIPSLPDSAFVLETTGEFPVIEVVPGEILTRKSMEKLPGNGKFVPQDGLLKLAVVQRHDGSGRIGLGAIRGFGLHHGALASTVGHDSHNLIVVGDNDRDMLLAVQELCRCGGGYTAVSDGTIQKTLCLPVAGLFTDDPETEIGELLSQMTDICRRLGVPETLDPYQNLSFLSLTVIPEIRLTDDGIYDVLCGRILSVKRGPEEL